MLVKGFSILICKSNKKNLLSRNRIPMRIIVRGANEQLNIPLWKMDAI